MTPSLKYGVIILTNGDYHPLQKTLKWQILDALLNRAANDYTDVAIERRKQRQSLETLTIQGEKPLPSTAVPDQLQKTLAGTYECRQYGQAWIKKEGDRYVLYLEHHPTVKGVLIYKKQTVFECVYSRPMFGSTNFVFI